MRFTSGVPIPTSQSYFDLGYWGKYRENDSIMKSNWCVCKSDNGFVKEKETIVCSQFVKLM